MLDTYDREVASKMTAVMMNDPKYSCLNLPLVRIRIDFSGGYLSPNLMRFGREFVGKLANPSDFLSFYKLKTNEAKLNDKEKQYTVLKGGL